MPIKLLTNYIRFLPFLIDRNKKARISGTEVRANSRMFRGRNIGQGTYQHAQGMRRAVLKVDCISQISRPMLKNNFMV